MYRIVLFLFRQWYYLYPYCPPASLPAVFGCIFPVVLVLLFVCVPFPFLLFSAEAFLFFPFIPLRLRCCHVCFPLCCFSASIFCCWMLYVFFVLFPSPFCWFLPYRFRYLKSSGIWPPLPCVVVSAFPPGDVITILMGWSFTLLSSPPLLSSPVLFSPFLALSSPSLFSYSFLLSAFCSFSLLSLLLSAAAPGSPLFLLFSCFCCGSRFLLSSSPLLSFALVLSFSRGWCANFCCRIFISCMCPFTLRNISAHFPHRCIFLLEFLGCFSVPVSFLRSYSIWMNSLAIAFSFLPQYGHVASFLLGPKYCSGRYFRLW